MIRRFRVFVESLLDQANRHRLYGELVIVEWNPPCGPRLHEVLEIQTKSEIFTIRYIEVPLEAHQMIRNSDAIPLFQMIAKNVGIRRAKGKFVLATNPDLIFSDALVAFLASGRLDPEKMYRLDRHDVPSHPPFNTSLDEQLDWCEANVLRVHRKWGSFPPTSRWQRLFKNIHIKSLANGMLRYSKVKFEFLAKLSGSWFCNWKAWYHFFYPAFWANGLRRAREVCARLLIINLFRRASRSMRLLPWKIVSRLRVAVYWPIRIVRSFLWMGVQYLDPLPKVHTNGCGDFTLLSREHWFALRGYPELPLWSMHLDSLLCYMAVASGLREEVLRPPAKMFHLEHENSWVVLNADARLKTFSLKPWIDIGLLSELWTTMYLQRRPVDFNGNDWGLASWSFDEVVIKSGKKSFITHQAPTPLAGIG